MERHEIEAGFCRVDRCRGAKRKLACQPNPEGCVKAKANWSSIFSARVIRGRRVLVYLVAMGISHPNYERSNVRTFEHSANDLLT